MRHAPFQTPVRDLLYLAGAIVFFAAMLTFVNGPRWPASRAGERDAR